MCACVYMCVHVYVYIHLYITWCAFVYENKPVTLNYTAKPRQVGWWLWWDEGLHVVSVVMLVMMLVILVVRACVCV